MNLLRIPVTLVMMLELSNTSITTNTIDVFHDQNNLDNKQNMKSLTEQLKLIGQQIQDTKEKLKNGAAQQLLNSTQITYYKDLLIKLVVDQNDLRHELKQKREEKTSKPLQKICENEQHPIKSEIVQDLLDEKVEGEIKKLCNKSDTTVDERKNTGSSDKRVYTLDLDKGHEMSRRKSDANKRDSNHDPKISMYRKRNRKHKAKLGADNTDYEYVSDESKMKENVPKWKKAFRSLKNSLKAHLYDIRNKKHYNRHDYKYIRVQEKSGKDSRRNWKMWNANEETDTIKDKLINDKEIIETDKDNNKQIQTENGIDGNEFKDFIEQKKQTNATKVDPVLKETNIGAFGKTKTDGIDNGKDNDVDKNKKKGFVEDNKKVHETDINKELDRHTSKSGNHSEHEYKNKGHLANTTSGSVEENTNNNTHEHKLENTLDIQKRPRKTYANNGQYEKKQKQRGKLKFKDTNKNQVDNAGAGMETDNYDEDDEDYNTNDIEDTSILDHIDYKNENSSSIDQKRSKMDQEESKKDQDSEQKESKQRPCDPITGIAVSILCLLSFLSILTLLLGTTDFILNDGRAKKVFSSWSFLCK